MWCMINNDAEGGYADWLRSDDRIPGVSHDGHNTVYPHIPPIEFDHESLTIPDSLTGVSLINYVGSFLATHGDRYIIGNQHSFEELYNTPHWRIWCANYNEIDMYIFEDDKMFFGFDDSLTQQECHELIWQGFINGE